MRALKKVGIGFLVLLAIAILFLTYRMVTEGAASREMRPRLGVSSGHFLACPESPNCISSYETDNVHSIDAIEGDAVVLEKIAGHLRTLKAVKVIEQSPNYVYATYQSKLFGFVDDIELYFDGTVIQVRSASRVGYSDMGINRQRLEDIRTAVEQW